MSRLQGKVAIVSGAGRGMGHAVAQLFADHGATVIATDFAEPEPFRGDVHFESLDVTKSSDWDRVVRAASERFGNVNVLVNNAGIIGSYAGVADITEDDWDKTIAVNQTGVWFGMRAVIPGMLEAGGGSIVNFSSIWGQVAVPGVAAYHASKGAVTTMSKNVAMTYATQGIRVNSVHPGFVNTPLTAAQDPALNAAVIDATPMKRGGEALEIAYGCLFLASDESSYITGTALVIDGGYTAQ